LFPDKSRQYERESYFRKAGRQGEENANAIGEVIPPCPPEEGLKKLFP
jgi:hypothetical protein